MNNTPNSQLAVCVTEVRNRSESAVTWPGTLVYLHIHRGSCCTLYTGTLVGRKN